MDPYLEVVFWYFNGLKGFRIRGPYQGTRDLDAGRASGRCGRGRIAAAGNHQICQQHAHGLRDPVADSHNAGRRWPYLSCGMSSRGPTPPRPRPFTAPSRRQRPSATCGLCESARDGGTLAVVPVDPGAEWEHRQSFPGLPRRTRHNYPRFGYTAGAV